MADHRNTGAAVLDTVRDAANRWVFTDAGEPWTGVRYVCLAGSPEPTHAVDITDTLALGIASLREHRVLEYVGGAPTSSSTGPPPTARDSAPSTRRRSRSRSSDRVSDRSPRSAGSP